VPEARTYLQPYPKDDVGKAEAVYQPAIVANMEEGLVAIYQKCVHLGCKVPWCQSSQWFECPCHGSKYNRVGEKRGGPAPRGLDHFAMEISGESITIDTSVAIIGAPIGTDTTGQGAEGPPCVGA
jgi:cytochrome b6-f complex iron-sulfur subunit